MRPKFQIVSKEFPDDDIVIFTLSGEFSDPDVILENIKPAFIDYRKIVIDVKNLKYLTSACFGIFFELSYLAKKGNANIYFFNMNPRFEIIFRGLGGLEVFEVIESLDEL